MIEIDGSDGGGGVLRTALGLAIATGRAVRVDDVRGARPEPGLKPQHVACVEAAAAVADADVEGDAIGSDAVRFDPDGESDRSGGARVPGGDVAVDVGTAGSATLVCSTVLPAAVAAGGTVRLRVGGGTDVAWSPPADYVGGVTLPALRAHGLAAALDVPARGFHPAGGGEVRLTVGPSTLAPLALDGDRSVERARVAAVASEDLLDADVADRMARAAGEGLSAAGVDVSSRAARYADTDSTGASVVVRAEATVAATGGTAGESPPDAVPVAGFCALGERGTPSEAIAERAVDAFRAWRSGAGVVDRHLADQLVPYLALAGGAVRVPAVTDHVASAVAVARAFDLDVAVDEAAAPGEAAVLRAPGRGE